MGKFERDIEKAVRPELRKRAKAANADLEKLYKQADSKSDSAVKSEIDKIAKKQGFEGVDAKGMVKQLRDGTQVFFDEK